MLGQRSQQEIGLVTRFPTPNEMMVFMVKRNKTKQKPNKNCACFQIPRDRISKARYSTHVLQPEPLVGGPELSDHFHLEHLQLVFVWLVFVCLFSKE